MTEPFWRITSRPDGLLLTKDERCVLLPWPFVALVANWKGPETGSAPLAFPDTAVRISIDSHGISIKATGTATPTRLPFTMLRAELEKRNVAA